jgi:tetratricopeptide (TPR) repeat protein
MKQFYEIYSSVVELYNNKKYKEVVNSVDKYLKLDFTSEKYIHNMRFLRAKSLRYLGRFDEAILELKALEKSEKNAAYSALELFYIYYFLNRYEEALELLPKLYNEKTKYISNHTLLIMELVMKKQLGIPVSYKKGTRSDYMKEQIMNYSSEKALQHIKNHKYEAVSYNIHSQFNDSVDIEYLMECVKKDIINSEKRNRIDALEVHYFSVSGVGYDDNSICNYLKVVVCPNTTNIITMYPFSNIENENVRILNCDRNKLFKKEDNEKNVSRINKFNKRFNLK